MSGSLQRPGVTPEIIRLAAQSTGSAYGWCEDMTSDVANNYVWPMGGYRLARKLKGFRDWSESEVTERMTQLDNMWIAVSLRVREAGLAWAKKHNIQPRLAIGSVIEAGVIVGYYDYEAASYLVRPHGCERGESEVDDSLLIIGFEEAENWFSADVDASKAPPSERPSPGPSPGMG